MAAEAGSGGGAAAPTFGEAAMGRLVLPCADDEEWARVAAVLEGGVRELSDLDGMLTQFSAMNDQVESRTCTFFAAAASGGAGAEGCGDFDFAVFLEKGVPVLLEVALAMPELFPKVEYGGGADAAADAAADAPFLPIFGTRSTWVEDSSDSAVALVRRRQTLSRRQCACLLAHSLLGSLRRPSGVKPNDFRFTVVDLFMGTAVSPNSATCIMNYFSMLGRHGFPEGDVTFERVGYRKGPAAPWTWEGNDTPLCKVELITGSIDDTKTDLHAEFANAFIGGGVMTGDFAQEEILFLVKPELMVAMALCNRMVDEEAIRIEGAVKYTTVNGFGSSMEFAGDCKDAPVATVCAIDAIRGGGPAMSKAGLLRDMNKARIAFDGSKELATGHWGCGAFGNNHDLMFLKQWLAASEAGLSRVVYHDFSKTQSHLIFVLIRKLKHLTVGSLWEFLLSQTQDLKPFDVASFSRRMSDVATNRIKVPEA